MKINLITSKKSIEFKKSYPFTNENVTSYERLFDINGSNVLSVLGSGDQYFSSLLYGAETVDLFDINMLALYHFVLKFIGIKLLSYEEFIDFFVTSRLTNIKIYNKIKSSLPSYVRIVLDNYIKTKGSLEYLIYHNYLNDQKINFMTGKVIPYFERNKFYELKSILKEVEFPKIYIMDLVKDLPDFLDKKYDIILLSNIKMYTGMSYDEFASFLKEKYYPYLNDGGVIQANYCWFDKEDSELYDIDEIESIKHLDRKDNKDYVMSLRK